MTSAGLALAPQSFDDFTGIRQVCVDGEQVVAERSGKTGPERVTVPGWCRDHSSAVRRDRVRGGVVRVLQEYQNLVRDPERHESMV